VTLSFTEPATQTIADLVAERYGGAVVLDEAHPLPTRTSSRTDDRTPFYGGDAVVDEDTHANCTTGFTLYRRSIPWITTAGHCAGGFGTKPLPHRYYNGGHRDADHYMGTVYARDYQNNGKLDYEVLSGDGFNQIWGGARGHEAFLRLVTSVATTDPIKGVICASGADAKEVCGVVIDRTNKCITFDDFSTTCGLVITHKSGDIISEDGDSGGPVETTIGQTETEARGMIVGGALDGPQDVMYYTPIRFITAAFGGTVD
jgi:hypothetical protein